MTDDRLSGLAMLLIHRETDFILPLQKGSMTQSQIGEESRTA